MFHPGGGVHLLGDDQRLGIEIERNGSVGARSRGRRLHLALGRLDAGNGIDHGFQVLGRGAAASAHDAHPVIRDEMLVILRQLVGAELVDRVSAFVLRQAGVGQHRDHAWSN